MFAKEKEFDPLIPENWYKVTRDDVEKQKVLFPVCFVMDFIFTLFKQGGQSVLFRHDNKLSEALLDLFPNIGLSKHKFNSYDGIAAPPSPSFFLPHLLSPSPHLLNLIFVANRVTKRKKQRQEAFL